MQHIDHKNIENIWVCLSFKVDMTFTLNDIDLQMTLTFKYALVEYKNAGEIYEL